MKKQLLLYILAVLICFAAGSGASGAVFAAACILAALPRYPQCPWYTVVIGALASDCAAVIFGESALVFWALTVAAALTLALKSLPKSAAAVIFAAAALKLELRPEIYVPTFVGLITGAILLFTYEKNCAIIKSNKPMSASASAGSD